MLMKVLFVKYNDDMIGSRRLASPEEAVISTDHIVSVVPFDDGLSDRSLVRMKFVDGTSMICVGVPGDFMEGEKC